MCSQPSFAAEFPLAKETMQPKVFKRSLSMPSVRQQKSRSMRRLNSMKIEVFLVDSIEEIQQNFNLSTESEEAVCRICLLDVNEGGSRMKIECKCKGDLAIAHTECVIKWFSISGRKSCDVCGDTVRNLPVVLLTSSRWREDDDYADNDDEDAADDDEVLSWHQAAAEALISALAMLWNKLEELSEFP